MPQLFLGTSSWTAPSWVGSFYPPGTPSEEFLAHYGRRFRAVEIDATWYHSPAPAVVDGWNCRTPEGFTFSAKVPQVITHTKILRDCEADLELFVEAMRRLGPKLGALLLQFPYFKRDVLPDRDAFLERLVPFLDLLPGDVRFALEIRNKGWLGPPLFEALRSRRIALAWVDHPYMPAARLYLRLPGALTADFLYVRLLGDRYGIEKLTDRWDQVVVDRERDVERWVEVMGEIGERVEKLHVYVNNHYSGCAYESAEQFRSAWERR